MEQLIQRCAGLDVHKKTVAACMRTPGQDGQRQQHTRTFATTTKGLVALRDWLASQQVRVVGMESTGAWWKAVYYRLETTMDCWLLAPATCVTCPAARPTSPTRPGSPSWSSTGWSAPASCHPADPGAAQPHPLPQDRHPRTHPRGPAAGETAGGRRHPSCHAWPATPCAPSSPNSNRPWSAASAPTMGCSSARCWPRIDAADATIQRPERRDRPRHHPGHRDPGAAADHPRVNRRTAEVILAETGGDMRQYPLGRAPGLLGWAVPRAQASRPASTTRAAPARAPNGCAAP